jgi:hypothetical protein
MTEHDLDKGIDHVRIKPRTPRLTSATVTVIGGVDTHKHTEHRPGLTPAKV